MASKSAGAKQLSELLQEEQEPFILETYIATKSEGSFSCWSCNSSKSLKRSSSGGLSKGWKVLPNCSKTVRAVFNKLMFIHNHKMKNSVHEGDTDFTVQRSYRDADESDKFSSASCTTVFNSCSESDIEDYILDTCNIVPRDKRIAADRRLGWRCSKDYKQNGSFSVLAEKNLDDGLLAHNKKKQHSVKVMRPVASSTSKLLKSKKVEDDSKISISVFELLVHTSIEKQSFTGCQEVQELCKSNPSSQYLNSIIALQQKNQLLFDCVREAVEAHLCRNKNRQRGREFLGPEALGELLSESLEKWSKLSADEANTAQLLNLDFLASVGEWSDLEFHKRETSMQVVDVILDAIVNEIVTDMIELC